jgi:hypothetical protein
MTKKFFKIKTKIFQFTEKIKKLELAEKMKKIGLSGLFILTLAVGMKKFERNTSLDSSEVKNPIFERILEKQKLDFSQNDNQNLIVDETENLSDKLVTKAQGQLSVRGGGLFDWLFGQGFQPKFPSRNRPGPGNFPGQKPNFPAPVQPVRPVVPPGPPGPPAPAPEPAPQNPVRKIPVKKPASIEWPGNLPSSNKQELVKKRRQELQDSQRRERELNEKNQKEGQKERIGVCIRDNREFWHPFLRLRKKFYHIYDLIDTIGFKMKVPFTRDEINELRKLENYRKRRKLFFDENRLSNDVVAEQANALRQHALDPNTAEIIGTINLKRNETSGGANSSVVERFHLYNRETGFNAFYNKDGIYITRWKLTDKQAKELVRTRNLM